MDLMMRRRALMGMGGKKTPVIDVIHPDAFYVKTRSNFAANSWLYYGHPQIYNTMTMFIVDGVEHSASDKDDYFTLDGQGIKIKLSGEHEYYIYASEYHGYSYYWGSSYIDTVRYPRGLPVNFEVQGSPKINTMIFVNTNPKIKSGVTFSENTVLYVPEGSTDRYAGFNNTEIVEVKYNIIED